LPPVLFTLTQVVFLLITSTFTRVQIQSNLGTTASGPAFGLFDHDTVEVKPLERLQIQKPKLRVKSRDLRPSKRLAFRNVHQSEETCTRVRRRAPDWGDVHQSEETCTRVRRRTPEWGEVHQSEETRTRVRRRPPEWGDVHQSKILYCLHYWRVTKYLNIYNYIDKI
jgi:hypothetical protein